MAQRLLTHAGLRDLLNRHRTAAWIVAAVGLFGLGFVTNWAVFGRSAQSAIESAPEQAPATDHAGHTGMAMPSMGLRQLTISPEARALMNIQTDRVERRYVTNVVRMVGKVEYDETRLKYITAWVPGRLDRLFVDFTGVDVNKGDHLVSIYSEELYAAQQELIEALRSARERGAATRTATGDIDLLESAREKLRLLGLTDEQIREIERQNKPQTHLTIYSPINGTVIEKLRQEGDRVKLGDRIYTVADLDQVWVKLDAYESDLMWLRYGQQVSFTTEAYPGEFFTGRIAFIDPILNETTRTAKVRVNVPNKDRKLKPEMFVHAEVRALVATAGRVIDPALVGKWICRMHPEVVADQPGRCHICGMELVTTESLGYFAPTSGDLGKPLVIPVSAPLITGKRAIVYVEVPDAEQPTFVGREIVLGPRAGDFYLVEHGLEEGELVVTRGNFKIDSAIQIEAKPSMMTPEGGGAGGMHRHGGEKPAKASQAKKPAMAIPAEFRKQLMQLEIAYRAVETAAESGDLERVRLAFQLLGESLDDVADDLLEGHPRMLWDDLKMLLTNDVVIGRTVAQPAELKRVLQNLREHMQRLRKQLMTTHSGPSAGTDDPQAHSHE